jgi:acyl-CoA hydrolase
VGTYLLPYSLDHLGLGTTMLIGAAITFELVTFSASVNYTGRTSMEIGIRVDTENVQQQSKRHTNSSYFTMVAVDAGGTPIPVPPRPLHTDVDKQRYESARLRRKALCAAFAAPHGLPAGTDRHVP